jgi:hypothetical protein
MPARTRYYSTNLLRRSGVVLVPSSEETSMPRSALLRSFLSDRWRTKTCWTVESGVNNRIEFNRGGVKNALVAGGHYLTGALLATAIQAAMTSADGATTWTVTYSSVTRLFTIAGTNAFTLLFGTGTATLANGDSLHIDIGFSGLDRASATTHVGERPSSQSRHWLNVDLGTIPGGAITITAGVNDRIDYDLDPSGPGVATVAPGLYLTPEDLCAAVASALNDSPATWTCTFDPGTLKFTISETPFPVDLLWSSGPNVARSIGPTLGFNVTDLTGFGSYTGQNPVTGSPPHFDALFLQSHNLDTGGVVEVHADTATMVGVGLAPSEADVSFTLTGDDPRVAMTGTQQRRFIRLVVYDVGNRDGFFETGIFFPAEHIGLSVAEGFEWVKTFEHLSEVLYAGGGANQQLRRGRRATWQLVYRSPDPEDIPRLEDLDDIVRIGGNFFVCFDPATPETTTYNVFLRQGVQNTMGPEAAIHIFPLELVEVLE